MSNKTLMAGKRGIVMGIANERSIGYGIAKALVDAGAELGLSYQGDALESRLSKLAPSLNDAWYAPCDGGDPVAVEKIFEICASRRGPIDFLVHAISL